MSYYNSLIVNQIKSNLWLIIGFGIGLSFNGSGVFGQTKSSIGSDFLYNHFHTLYKLDQNLVNGTKYYKPRETVSGNEFFMDKKASRGEIILNGITYSNVFLKYDIVNQDVILEYDFPSGGKMQIIIEDEKISDFEIFERTFRKLNFPLTGKQFFQVINAGNLVCLIHWRKILIPVGSSLQYTYQYSEEKRKTYLLREDQLFQFGGQRSFSKLFPGFKKEIRQYLRRYNLEIRNISDTDLTGLIEYCSSLNTDNPKAVIQ